ncbi:MAG: efflux RND transporter permease subunit [Proteobacteria bacterium]|nr:efflux RND transporter permease subunit [Pseudomonadota bacterium]
MPSITEFSLKTERVTILFMAFVVLSGIYVFLDYPKQEDPSIVIREAVVTAMFPGMATTRVEDLITRKLEEKIREIGEIDDIKSDSKTGVSIIHVVARDEVKDLEPVWQDLRNKMNDVKAELPEGTFGPLVNDEFGLTAVATIALWSDGFTLAEMRDVARNLRDQFYAVEGVMKVELFGVQDEQVYLELSNTKLAQYGVSPDVVVQTLKAQNIILPGGAINVDGTNVIVEPSGNFNQITEIESVLIPIPGTEKVAPLRDLVIVVRDYVDPPEKPVFFNGRPAIVLSVSTLKGVNSVEFGERLTWRIKELEQTLPIGYVLDYATYQPALVEKAVSGAVNNLYQTLAIVLAVVMVFLGIRTGLIVGSFVPLAMLLGIVVMSLFDIEFQRMSVAAMIISLGMLVDNGIVVAEDIRVRLERGEERRQAAIESGKVLAIPLLTSSLTTILAFMPLMLAVGGTGEYTLSLGQVVIILLLGSWFLAMYVTPVMCVRFMKVKTATGTGATDPYDTAVYRTYRRFLGIVLHNRLVVLGSLVAFLIGAGYAFNFVVKSFFPPGDRNQFLVYIDLPAGSHIDKTASAVGQLTDWLQDKKANPEVTGTIAYVGSGGPRFFLSLAPIDPDPHVAFMVVNTETEDQVPEMVERVDAYALDNLPDVDARPKAMWLGATETGLIEIRVSGSDADVLVEKAEKLKAALRAVPGTIDIRHDWENRVVTVEVLVDQVRARRAKVTSQEVANSLNAYIDGARVTEYREGDKIIPIVIRGLEEERDSLANLRAISVYSSQTKKNVPLVQIADLRPRWDYSRIKRRNQERTITVSAKHRYLKAGQLFEAVQPTIDALELPPGYWWEHGGELEGSAKAQGYLFASMPLAGGLIVFLLVWQFNSFRRPLIILLTIPMAFVGAVLGLLVMKAEFGFMSILGLLSLAGIIINNGIVLIDRIDIERAAGKDPYDAVVTAAITRFRPILMTTITTILGLLPLIVSKDPLFYSMAIVIAFGLLIGTVLTLGIVPVLYSLLFRAKIPGRPAAATAPA